MVAALLVTIGMAIMNGYHISWGTGYEPSTDHTYATVTDCDRQHLKYLNVPAMRIPTLKHFYFYQLVYPLALFFVKASILALYHRIFVLVKFRYKVYAVAAFVTVYTIIVLFVNVNFLLPTDSNYVDFSRLSNAGLSLHKHGHLRFLKVVITCEQPTSR
jgi:hypothetical protein